MKGNVPHFKKVKSSVNGSQQTESELDDEIVGRYNIDWKEHVNHLDSRLGHSFPSRLIPRRHHLKREWCMKLATFYYRTGIACTDKFIVLAIWYARYVLRFCYFLMGVCRGRVFSWDALTFFNVKLENISFLSLLYWHSKLIKNLSNCANKWS